VFDSFAIVAFSKSLGAAIFVGRFRYIATFMMVDQ